MTDERVSSVTASDVCLVKLNEFVQHIVSLKKLSGQFLFRFFLQWNVKAPNILLLLFFLTHFRPLLTYYCISYLQYCHSLTDRHSHPTSSKHQDRLWYSHICAEKGR